MNFSLRYFLSVFFLLSGLVSVSAYAACPLPYQLADLSKEFICKDLDNSLNILAGFDLWAKKQGKRGVYSWLGRKLFLNGYRYRPLVLVAGNAYAIHWFLERAFNISELNSQNTDLIELLNETLTAAPVERRNEIINSLLETSFGMQNSTWLAEVLFNLVTSEPYRESVSINYQSLFSRALQARNYRLIADFLLLSRHVVAPQPSDNNNDFYRNQMLRLLASNPYVWEPESDVDEDSESQWHYAGISESSPIVGNEGANAAAQANEAYFNENREPPVQSPFRALLAWLATPDDRNILVGASRIAFSRNNEPVINWLESLGIPRLHRIENFEYQNQPRAENDSQVQIIDVEPEVIPSCWDCFGCFRQQSQ